MKSIRCWDDLSAHGIIPLTGEACGLSYRILCDVTSQGKKTLEKSLGVAQLGLHENWNHGSADDPHVGSYVVIFVMWRRAGSPRRFDDGVLAERHILGCECAGERSRRSSGLALLTCCFGQNAGVRKWWFDGNPKKRLS